MKIAIASTMFAIGLTGSMAAASADSMPGMRGHDHTGITVPDMKQAVDFFTEVVGCKKAMSFGPFSDDKGTFMQDLAGVDPKAVIEQITQLRCGYGSNIELFKYTAPDQKDLHAKNSDIGGFHIAFYVDDVAAVKAYLQAKGVATRLGPLPVKDGPARQGRPLSISRHLGDCSWKRSAILMGWRMKERRYGAVEPERAGKVMS